MQSFTVVGRLYSIRAFVVIAGLLFGPLSEASTEANPKTTAITDNIVTNEWVDLIVQNGHLYIPSEVQGHAGFAVIDTGGELNAVNEAFIADSKLKLPRGRPINIIGVHGRDRKPMIKSLPVNLLGNSQTLKDVVRADIGSSNVQLLLGGRFLSLSIFQFDYPNKRMRVLSRDDYDLRTTKNVRSKRDRVGGSPIVQVHLNAERRVWLTMDTGAGNGIILRRSIAATRGWLGRYPTKPQLSSGINTSDELVQFTLPSLSIGEFETQNPVVYVARKYKELEFLKRKVKTGSYIKRSATLSDGIMGHDVLKNFVVTVDYKEGHVHLGTPEIL